MARRRKPIPLTRRERTWWDKPVGGALVVVGVGLAVLSLVTATGRIANLSWHVLCATIAVALLVSLGLAFATPKYAGRFCLIVVWPVPAALVWVGLEHWLDWHEFYSNTHGKGRLTTPTGAKVRGSVLIAVAIGFFAFCVGLVRDSRRPRRTRSRPGA